ncbi:PilZ domain-containing protein [Exilibacterium tricleocarpae]|uniref:PilZ domain-containing protein n=1 Tax=Exilibacterium tricleocarpae TaxID=2591008 RepID=A0A545TNC6_9GAMM|nr:PilZ domain-containing protein [Exilibacterium tricleocarpae]TQV78706.1 PilZ domain-containing protein [Exilibacterium tricleocarpae]
MNLAKREYTEKRNFIRMKIDTPADVSILSDDTQLQGICRDLSGGGMMIEVDKTLPVGTELEVTITSAHGHQPLLRAMTVITRVDADHSGTCTLGMKIQQMLS